MVLKPLNECSYTRTYANFDSRRYERYKCDNKQYSERLCIFHLESYAADKKNREGLIELLKQSVEQANASRTPLKWIGYHIPPGFAIHSEFKVDVYLDDAKFLGDADFTTSIFRNASFVGAEFKGKKDFTSTTFIGEAIFSGAVYGKINFSASTFNAKAFFNDSNSEYTVFDGATFSGEAQFIARLEGRAFFTGTTFNAKAYFKEAEFVGGAEFDSATFSGEAILPYKGNILFTNVLFKDQEKVFFNGDLSEISFANTDITRVRFGDKVLWGRKQRNSRDGKSKEQAANDKNKLSKEEADFKIYDERLIEESLKNKNEESKNSLEAVIAEYRNLRENYEYNLRYEEAGQFFIREMELRRKYKQKSSVATGDEFLRTSKIEKKNILERMFSFAALYYFISDYGESTRKPLGITLSVFLIATLYFWYLKGWSMDGEIVSDSISRTLTAFFPFFSLPEDSGLLEMALRATMIPLAGLLFITLRRKLERRFRH